MSKNKRDFAIIMIGRILQLAFALLSVRLTTTLLGPEQVGRMNLILGITSWFGLLLISPVGNYVFRQALEWNDEGKLLGSVGRYALFLIGVAVIELLSLFIIHLTIGIGTPIQLPWLLWLVIATLIFGALNTTFITLINTLGFRGWFVLFSNLNSWLGLGVAVALALLFRTQAEYWMTGLLIGQTIVMIGAGLLLYKVAGSSSNKPASSNTVVGFDVAAVFRFSWPLIIATAFYWLQNSGFRFILVGLTDEATVGLLATGMAIAMSPMVMFDTLFTEYYRPIFYRDIAHSSNLQRAEAWNRYANSYFPAIILIAVYVAFGSPFLAKLLVGPAFQHVSWLAFGGAVVQASLMIYATYMSLVYASLDTKTAIWPNIIGAIVAVIGLLVFVPGQPLLGAAIALSIGIILTTFLLARKLKRNFALRVPWRRITQAGLAALPLAIGLEVFHRALSSPTLLQSIVGLGIGGLYLLVSQYMLARPWLFPDSKIALNSITQSMGSIDG